MLQGVLSRRAVKRTIVVAASFATMFLSVMSMSTPAQAAGASPVITGIGASTSHAAAPAPAVLNLKSATLSHNGSTITYVFTVKNTSKTTLSHVHFTYSITGAKSGDPSCRPATLKPGKTATCTITYKVKKADKGKTITATITVTASMRHCAKVTLTKSADVTVPAPKPACPTKVHKVTPKCKCTK